MRAYSEMENFGLSKRAIYLYMVAAAASSLFIISWYLYLFQLITLGENCNSNVTTTCGYLQLSDYADAIGNFARVFYAVAIFQLLILISLTVYIYTGNKEGKEKAAKHAQDQSKKIP